uniref:RNA-binding protein 4B-like isoform X3 n=1 Tax=Pristiophorus japonicus TaxID=55135 RepID=UPI00398E7F5A
MSASSSAAAAAAADTSEACGAVKHDGLTPTEETPRRSELQGRPEAAAPLCADSVAPGGSQEPQAHSGPATDCADAKDSAFVHVEHKEEALKAISKTESTDVKARKIGDQLSGKSTKPQSAGGPVGNCQRCGRPGHQAAECFWAPYGSLDRTGHLALE